MSKVIIFLDVDETCAIRNRHDGGYRYNEILLVALQTYEPVEIYLLTSYILSGIAKNLEEKSMSTPSRLRLNGKVIRGRAGYTPPAIDSNSRRAVYRLTSQHGNRR